MTIGENLKAYREAAGLSQRELGEAIGVARRTVSNWERNQNLTQAIFLRDIAAALGVSVDAILDERGANYEV